MTAQTSMLHVRVDDQLKAQASDHHSKQDSKDHLDSAIAQLPLRSKNSLIRGGTNNEIVRPMK